MTLSKLTRSLDAPGQAPSLTVLMLFGFVLVLLAPDVFAASSGGEAKYGLETQTQTDLVSSAKNIWNTVANIALYGGLIGTVGLYLLGLTQYIRWGLFIAIAGGFGEQLINWIADAGGLEKIGGDDDNAKLNILPSHMDHLAAVDSATSMIQPLVG